MSIAQNRSARAIGVATAAIPAVVFGTLASPAAAAPLPTSTALQPKIATPAMLKAAEARISSHLVASQIPTSVIPLAKKSETVTVRKGDTLSHIALRTNVSVAALKKANSLRSDTIFPGQTLRLKASGSTTSAPKAQASSATVQATQQYKVVAGDTLSGIAKRLGVTLTAARAAAGNPSRDLIHIGQALRFAGSSGSVASSSGSAASQPSSQQTSTSASGSYVVQAGDTPSGIALRHNMSLSSFLKLNGLTSRSTIYPKQVLKVSGGSAAPSQSTGSQTSSSSSSSSSKAPTTLQGSYTVVSGDTLIGIALKTNTPVNTLLKLNTGISYSSTLSIGQRLKTSGSASGESSVNPTASKPLVGNTFLGRTYSSGTVNSANLNKQTLLASNLPSRAQMQSMVAATARAMGVDPSLALAHAFQESSFNMASVSPANAVGVMQVIPSAGQWAEGLVGRKLNLLDPQDNVTAGVAIIRHHQRNSPSKEIGIAAYYQGAAGVRKYGMYSDTKRYVANILALEKRF